MRAALIVLACLSLAGCIGVELSCKAHPTWADGNDPEPGWQPQ